MIRRYLLNLISRRVFHAIMEEDIVPTRLLPIEERRMLSAEARAIASSKLWKRLLSSSRTAAKAQMFEGAKSWDDMYFGKAVLYVADMMERRVDELSKLSNPSDE